jgi:ribonuclease HII
MAKVSKMLKSCYFDDEYVEVGIDEAGRGPMFGRVYAAAVVLPKSDEFRHCDMKDSKRFHSDIKIHAASNYIKDNSIAWAIGYSTEEEIDKYNIRVATHMAMHKAIKEVIFKLKLLHNNTHLLVDGNDFTSFIIYDNDCLLPARTTTIEQGDNKISSIAAASILAKVARDDYIVELCNAEPDLNTKYGLIKNKGYGTKQHLSGITDHGISKYHRTTFGICRNYIHKIELG